MTQTKTFELEQRCLVKLKDFIEKCSGTSARIILLDNLYENSKETRSDKGSAYKYLEEQTSLEHQGYLRKISKLATYIHNRFGKEESN